MKKILFNKKYKNLRFNIFKDLEFNEFVEIYSTYKKLNFQYRLLKICKGLEKINIKVIEIPIFRFLSKLLDFLRWKLYDS